MNTEPMTKNTATEILGGGDNLPAEKGKVWKGYNEVSFEQEVRRYGGYGLVNKIQRGVKSIVRKGKKVVKSLIGR